ncbi:hypothetical protein PIB30_104431 [Stylosanthes scabra]|uniref:Uncharacterized protein n=1 Tax=Stylosanthes scabra TaxID=79078 RepID=A0ABU6TXR9_9FABA|nr:hypothetical protein [Stylosanthes scabra]
MLLPHISVDFHAYAWVFILGLELGWPPRICLLQRIYMGLMNLEVELAFHGYACFNAYAWLWSGLSMVRSRLSSSKRVGHAWVLAAKVPSTHMRGSSMPMRGWMRLGEVRVTFGLV